VILGRGIEAALVDPDLSPLALDDLLKVRIAEMLDVLLGGNDPTVRPEAARLLRAVHRDLGFPESDFIDEIADGTR
jgi:hypothetical protein